MKLICGLIGLCENVHKLKERMYWKCTKQMC